VARGSCGRGTQVLFCVAPVGKCGLNSSSREVFLPLSRESGFVRIDREPTKRLKLELWAEAACREQSRTRSLSHRSPIRSNKWKIFVLLCPCEAAGKSRSPNSSVPGGSNHVSSVWPPRGMASPRDMRACVSGIGNVYRRVTACLDPVWSGLGDALSGIPRVCRLLRDFVPPSREH
jgi:hypothetical protein